MKIKHYNYGDKPFPWGQGNHEPSVSQKTIKTKIQSQHDQQVQKLMALLEQRNHTLISGEYKNVKSCFIIKFNIVAFLFSWHFARNNLYELSEK